MSMRQKCLCVMGVSLGVVIWAAGSVHATPARRVSTCQKTVSKEGGKYVARSAKTIQKCLQRYGKEVVAKNRSLAAAGEKVAKSCQRAFNKIAQISTKIDKQLDSKLQAKVAKKCDADADLEIALTTLPDYGGGNEELGALGVGRINALCGDVGAGSVTDDASWSNCIVAAADCQVAQSIALEFPQAAVWLNALHTAVLALDDPDIVSADDPAEVAAAAIAALAQQIDSDGDDVADIACGDSSSGGGAATSTLPVTGQTQCVQSGTTTLGSCTTGSPDGQDGSVRAGQARSYTDNGDGTISDNVTGLMWAKKSDSVGLHDKDMIYTWYDAFNVHIAGLNSGNFAGYNDWRLPNIIELQSLVVYDGNNPAVDPAFDTGCTFGCTVTACSCTRPGSNYWTSTSYASSPALAWFVNSEAGVTNALSKNASFYVRAVRGGL